jgi:hypothetical protein
MTEGTYEGLLFGTINAATHSDGSDWLQAVPLEVDMANGTVLPLGDHYLQF